MTPEWEWNGDYSIAFAPTDDPRLLAVIQRDDGPHPPDGDMFAPAAFIEYRGGGYRYRKAGAVFDDDDAFDAYVNALNYYGFGDPRVERYMRAFHGVRRIETVDSYVHQNYGVVILDTPAYRQHVGIFPDIDNILTGDVDTWQAYLNGDVFGVGWAVNEGRVMDDGEPIDLEQWDIEIQCWGYFGEEWAKEDALAFSNGAPDLHPLLPFKEAS